MVKQRRQPSNVVIAGIRVAINRSRDLSNLPNVRIGLTTYLSFPNRVDKTRSKLLAYCGRLPHDLVVRRDRSKYTEAVTVKRKPNLCRFRYTDVVVGETHIDRGHRQPGHQAGQHTDVPSLPLSHQLAAS